MRGIDRRKRDTRGRIRLASGKEKTTGTLGSGWDTKEKPSPTARYDWSRRGVPMPHSARRLLTDRSDTPECCKFVSKSNLPA